MTKKCIICLKDANIFTGHVLTHDNEKITAGWCKNHIEESENMYLMKGSACFGDWKQEYGIKEIFKKN